ncbi:MAG: hypothetical protein ABFQ95_08385, partial [Pseudomonadota bacterium]
MLSTDRHPERWFWNSSLVRLEEAKPYDSGSHFLKSAKKNWILNRKDFPIRATYSRTFGKSAFR